MRTKRIMCIILLAALLASAYPVFADNSNVRTVIGADLTQQQVDIVYSYFGITRGSCIEMTMTNADERALLSGVLDESVIGTRSISCVYFELLPSGSGIQLSTRNIDQCTADMYTAALATAGITDARIIVAAPFEVSGSAAVAGIYKAYEDISGKRLDSSARQAGTQELSVTGELIEQTGNSKVQEIINELKQMLDLTRSMSDEQLKKEIKELAAKYYVKLNDTQVQQIFELCRTMEKLDIPALKSRIDSVRNAMEKLGEVKDQAVGFAQRVGNFFQSVKSFFQRVKNWF